MTYSYFHTNYTYTYNDPFSFIKDANGNEVFYGSVKLPNGKGFDIYPGDFLGYVGKKEWAVHNLAYDDKKNQFHARIGVTDIKKDGFSSADGPEETISAGDLQKWNGQGSLSFYPSKTKDFDMHKAWDIGKHTLLAGMAYRSESFDQTRYTLDQWRNLDTGKRAYELHGGKDESWSGYLQDKWQATDRLAVYAGIRFDRYKNMMAMVLICKLVSTVLMKMVHTPSGAQNFRWSMRFQMIRPYLQVMDILSLRRFSIRSIVMGARKLRISMDSLS